MHIWERLFPARVRPRREFQELGTSLLKASFHAFDLKKLVPASFCFLLLLGLRLYVLLRLARRSPSNALLPVLSMLVRSLLCVSLTASIVQCVFASPRRISVPARRQGGLRRRDMNEAASTKHVVVDFTFGGQQIPVALDTGSSFTYVASTLDTSETEIALLPALFNPNASSTYHDEDNPEDSTDCGGETVTCVLGVDNVATAGLTANNMTFGVASHIAASNFASGQAATMGLGRQAGDPSNWLPRDQTFWLHAGADLEVPYLFTVDIYQDRNGTFDFGWIDTAKYTGEITFASMDTEVTNWNFKMTAFTIGNGSSQTVDTFTGVVDTGGPNIGLPSYIVNPYFESFGGTPSPGHSHDYPCEAYPPPDLTLDLEGGGKLVLNGSFLVDPPEFSSKTCSGRVDNSYQTGYNIGASVLDQKFVIFDHANARVGFAEKRRDGQPEGVLPSSMTSPPSTTATVTPTGTASLTTDATATGTTAGATPSSSSSSALGRRQVLHGSTWERLSICALCAFVVCGSI